MSFESRHGIAEPTRTRSGGTRVTSSGLDPQAKLAALRRIVVQGQYEKIDGTTVDLFSASAIVAVYDKLNEENRKRFLGFHVRKMAIVAFKLLK